jgi:uncharacterized low-complexity protein
MSKHTVRKPLTIALGTAVVASLGAAGIANASEEGADLFSMEELDKAYLIAGGHEKDDDESDKEGEGKCGEGKCGSA